MRGSNQYKNAGCYSSGAAVFRFLLKSLLVLALCLAAYLWGQRRSIAHAVIRRQLNRLEITDLDFTVAELSPYRFELRDVSWGEPGSAFLELAAVKVIYTPRGLFAGGVDKVVVRRFESALQFDPQNRPYSELLVRLQQVAARVRQVYPPGAGGTPRPLVLPEFEVERGTVRVAGGGGLPAEGQIDFDLRFGGGAGELTMRGKFALPQGRAAAVQGRVEILAPDISAALDAGITASLDLSAVAEAAPGFNLHRVDLSGAFRIRGLAEGMPQWELQWELPHHRCQVQSEDSELSAALQGRGGFSGSATALSGSGALVVSNLLCEFKGVAERPAIRSAAERVYLSFELAESALADLGGAVFSGSGGADGVRCSADELVELREGALNVPVSFSAAQGIQFGKTEFGWSQCRLGGVDFVAGELRLSLSNSAVQVQSSLAVRGEPLQIEVACTVPLSNPQAGDLRVDIPAVVVDSSAVFGRLVRQKSGGKLDFSGEISAVLRVDGLYPGAAVTGMVRLVNGSCRNEKAELSGIEAAVPLRFADGAFRSTGEPVLTIESLQAGNIRMGPGRVLFHLSERELFVERVQMAWAKGSLHAYAIHAGFDGNIRNEFTVYADKIDLGEVFMLVMPFDGEMEGILYGRFPVLLKKKRVELSGGYLYSLPDQGGRLKLNDPAQMETLLSRAGIIDDREKSLSHALSDLDLTAIRLDLEPRAGGDSSLRIKLHGKSNYVKRPAPVNLNLNLNGQLQQLLDLGLDIQRF